MTHAEPATAPATEDDTGFEELAAIFAAMRNGDLPRPLLGQLLGMYPVDLKRGEATFALDPAEKHYNPLGTFHGGVAATMLDTAMGCAVHTTLPAGASYTTSNIDCRYIRTVTVETGTVLAIGTVLHTGRRTATAEGRLVAERDGKLLATATSTLLVLS